MKQAIFTGACTALVTPFLQDRVNYPMLELLLKRQLDAGIRTVVLCGTTGESSTLSDGEKIEMIHRAKQYTGGACTIIAGTGSNSTEHTIALSCAARDAGADALLVVSPYYIKATDEGLAAHYTAVASAAQIPVIIYNVPSRTGVDIPVEVYRLLSKLPNIAGVKEASTASNRAAEIRRVCPPDFYLWCGNDSMAVSTMAIGGAGVISVLSNLLPEKTQAMAMAALDGDFDTAAALQLEMMPLIHLLFQEINPIPVKAAMQLMGYDCGTCRLPLTPASGETIQALKQLLGH